MMKRRTRKELAAILILILLCGCTRTNPAAEAEATMASADMNLAESQETAETQALDFPDVSQEEKNVQTEETAVQAEETAVQTEAESTAAAAETESSVEETGSEERERTYVDDPDTSDYLEVLEKTLDPGYLLENSDSAYLTEEDISGFSKDKLRFARNEIFARHGKVFEDKILQSFFYTRAWYHEEEGKEIQLNKYESYNCDLIQKREDQLENEIKEAPEQKGWVFLKKKDNKCSYHGMEINLSQDQFDPGDMPDYLVKYKGKEFHLDDTWMECVYRVAARTSQNGVMILLTGEDEVDNIYTFGYEITPEGIRGIGWGDIPVMLMDDYVCFWWCEDMFFGVEYYEWKRIDDRGNTTTCMGAYDAGEMTWTAEVPQEVKVLNGTGIEKKEIIQPGEQIRLISRLPEKIFWDNEEETGVFFRIKRLSTGETVWLYWRENSLILDEVLLCFRFKQDGEFLSRYYMGRAWMLYHEKSGKQSTNN